MNRPAQPKGIGGHHGGPVSARSKAASKNEKCDSKMSTVLSKDKEAGGKRHKLSNTEDLSADSRRDFANASYNLRQYTRKNYLDFGSEAGGDDNNDVDFGVKKLQARERKDSELDINETIEYDRLPKNLVSLQRLLLRVEASLEQLRLEWFKE